MSEPHWPTDIELVSFVDVDLTPEQLENIEVHLRECSACEKQVRALRALANDLRGSGLQSDFDVDAHVAGVMKRLDQPASQAKRGPRWAVLGAVLLPVAAALALFVGRAPITETPHGELTARGGAGGASLARDVGVVVHARDASLRPLHSGAEIRSDTPLTASMANVGKEPAHLLLFALDSQKTVHWIAPQFTVAGTDPQAVVIAPSSSERVLASAAVFEDLAPGPLRVVAVVTREPTHVSDVEKLTEAERSEPELGRRFPNASIRETALQVAPARNP